MPITIYIYIYFKINRSTKRFGFLYRIIYFVLTYAYITGSFWNIYIFLSLDPHQKRNVIYIYIYKIDIPQKKATKNKQVIWHIHALYYLIGGPLVRILLQHFFSGLGDNSRIVLSILPNNTTQRLSNNLSTPAWVTIQSIEMKREEMFRVFPKRFSVKGNSNSGI